MIEVKKKIRIDMLRKSQTRIVFATQNDVGFRRVEATVTNDGKPIAFDSPVVAHANFLRPDGESGAVLCNVKGEGIVGFTIPLWALSVVGEVKCSISLFGEENSRVTSPAFSIDVEAELYSGEDVFEDEDYPLITSLMSTLAGYTADEEKRKAAEEEREAAELERRELVKRIERYGVVIVSDEMPDLDGPFVWIDPSADEEIVIPEANDLADAAFRIDGDME